MLKGQIEPNENCVMLVPNTEVVVSPNVRTTSGVHSEKPTSSDQSAISKLGPSQRYLSVEEELNSLGTDVTAEEDEVDESIFEEEDKTVGKQVVAMFGKVNIDSVVLACSEDRYLANTQEV